MLVFWKQRLVFLSVPKTGTTAFEAVLAPMASMAILEPPELKHAPVYRYNRFFRPMFEKACKTDDMETLAVMREPISWLGSWYRFRRRPFMRGRPNATFDITFDEFVEGYMDNPRPGFANVGSQAKFLEPRPNGTRVTHLFRYEDQPSLIAFLQERLDATLDLPRLNVSPDIELTLSHDVEKKLRRKCAAEFDLWESIGPR
ncbi:MULTISPECIES: sulfotransferase family 2 domain-containing protein [Sediminimonas]|uniref:sulfotransferase family 2 domain-containing protein n=1 Tax=Sediminimonas TaxID=659427 RepID=UPI000418B213|nr:MULTISPECIES: sulfotransferase family 2 domain-containing protein [Sediminimonas]MDR9486254.1 sulfotransferase family 2 domain-containing protein [Sediminimonas sp.]